MAKLTCKEYVKAGGSKCPVCDGEQLEGRSSNFTGCNVYQRITCLDCGAEWEDEYALIGYVGLEEEKK